MKRILSSLALSLLLVSNNTMAQFAASDAMHLSRLNPVLISDSGYVFFPVANSSLAAQVLANYTGGGTYSQIQKNFSNNPFIRLPQLAGSSAAPAILGTQGISALGGLNVTTFADGLAKFLVERVKEELSTAFFTRFKDELAKYPDLQILFPTTYTALRAVDVEIYNYTSYINLLREAFIKDFQTMLPQLRRLVMDKRYEPFFNNPSNKFLQPILLTSISISEQLQHGKHPGEILHNVANDATLKLDSIDPNLKPSFLTLDLFVQSLRSNSQEHYLVPFDTIRQYLFRDEITLRIYLGLLYQQAENINFTIRGQSKSFRSILDSAASTANEFEKLKSKIEEDQMAIADRTNAVHQTLQAIRQQNRNPETKATYSEYFSFYSQTLDLLEYSASVAEKWGASLNEEKKNTYFFVARSAGNCYLDINQKKYASAILGLYSIYDTVFVKNKLSSELNRLASTGLTEKPTLNAILPQVSAVAVTEKGKNLIKDLQKLIADTTPNCETISKKLKELSLEITSNQSVVIQKLIKYGNFGAQLAAAENSEDVKNLIESVALPAGSSSIKRKSSFNVSLNSYVGIFGGSERIKGVDNSFRINSYGLAAPVGISVSRGHSIFFIGTGKKNWGWSSSIFLSIVDIGAIASFRFTNDSTESIPNIELKDIISPGIFFSLGIPKTPISINAGYQIGPLLRKVTATNNELGESYTRISISVCVDIPLLNFYTKSR
jgi:hypothetical protein